MAGAGWITLEFAIAHDPVRYLDLIASQRPRAVPPWRDGYAGTRRAWRASSNPPVENA